MQNNIFSSSQMGVHKPIISIITVVFNGERFIKNTIESIVGQVESCSELVVIDGASTDGTLDLIRRYSSKIDYWVSEPDNGIYDAMNKGIRAATGDYLIFLNAGDTFSDENVLASVAEAVISNGYPDILYGETNVFSEKGEFVKRLVPLRFSGLNLTLFGTRVVCHQSIFVKRQSAPLYDTSFKLKGELYWYYDLLEKNRGLKSVSLPFPVANYLLGGVGDVLFKRNFLERLKVVARKEGIFGFVLAIFSLAIPVVFRLKRILHGIVCRNKEKK